jgi:hypothetical protein
VTGTIPAKGISGFTGTRVLAGGGVCEAVAVALGVEAGVLVGVFVDVFVDV